MTQIDGKVNRFADDSAAPFWKTKSLDALNASEWESLCDGCGRCCLLKLEDVDTEEVHYTNIACHLLDEGTCRCTDYDNRVERVPTCLSLTPAMVRETAWLPPTCAYRLVAEGRDLYWWHPLVSSDPDSVVAAGISVKGRIVAEAAISVDDYEDFIVDWPMGEGTSV